MKTTIIALLSLTAWSQSPLTGSFVLAEEGGGGTNAIAALGIVTFDGKGNATGNQFVQTQGSAQTIPVSGRYTIAPDGSGTLVMNTQIPTEDGPAPAISATYEFFSVKAAGFVAVRKDAAMATIAKFLPLGKVRELNGSFLYEGEGVSASGQSRAEIAVLQMRADGSLAGKLVVRNGAIQEPLSVTGSYVNGGNGMWTLRLITPGDVDEEGNVGTKTITLLAAITSRGEWVAIHSDNSILGLGTIQPLQ